MKSEASGAATTALAEGSPGVELSQPEFSKALAAEVEGGRQLCLALFDLDRLIAVEARAGAPPDEALRALAGKIIASAAQAGVAARLSPLGRGQIAQLLPGVRAQVAADHAERVRAEFEALGLNRGTNRAPLTVTVGLAEFPFDARNADEVLRRADEAVQRAKRLGRNRCSTPPPRLLVVGSLPLFEDVTRTLLARGEFLVHTERATSQILAAFARERPRLVIADLLAVRKDLAAIAEAAAQPEHTGAKIIFVTSEGPDPALADLARRVPGANLLMGEARLLPRLVEAVTQALGVKKRKPLRASVKVPVKLEVVERKVVEEGALIDISESGARVSVQHPLVPGEEVWVSFSWEQRSVQLVGVAVRVLTTELGGVEVGIRFERLDESELIALRQILGEADDAPEEEPAGAPRVQAAPQHAFKLEGVSRSYGSFPALQAVTLSVKPKERIALIGPSGSGKSTLLRLLNTSLLPTQGRLEVLGQNPAELSPSALRALRSRIGTIYQQLLLIPQASVLQNVIAGRLGRTSLFKSLLSLLSRKDAQEVTLLLDRVGLASKLYERVDTLSGGEQQRVAIARALYQDPEVLLADEPLASLDPARAAEVVEQLLHLGRNRTVIIATHQLESVLPHFSRVIGLKAGQIIFDKSRADLTLDDLARVYESERAARPGHPDATLSPRPAPGLGATVVVGASTTPGEFVLPRVVSAFVEEAPGVKVQLVVKPSLQVIDDLRSQQIELAFSGMRIHHPELHFEEITEDEVILVASPGFSGLGPQPIRPSLVGRLPRVERQEGAASRAIVEDRFAEIGAPLPRDSVALEVSSLVALKAAVLSGMGVAFISRMAARPELIAGTLVEVKIEGVRISRRLFVAWRNTAELSLAARRFVQIARQVTRPAGVVQG